MTRQECFELLGRASIGRIGVSIDALPVILPVYFVLDEESVLFRTIPGSRLDSAAVGAVVAFQADADEPSEQIHWSVLLQGIATGFSDWRRGDQSTAASIPSWGTTDSPQRTVRLDPAYASGRKFYIGSQVVTPRDRRSPTPDVWKNT